MEKNRQKTFGSFRLDEMNECLWRESQALALRPKVFAVLKYLLEHPGRLVTKQQLQVDLAEVELDVPENIRHLIEKQIERLGHEEQQVLEAASVVGLECSAVAIAAALGEGDVVQVEERCEELARHHQFISPSRLVELPDGTITPRHKFIHVLYLDVLYSRISVTRRAQMHRRVGESGETIYGARCGEIAAELAVHFEQGRDGQRAVKYLQLAAENAAHRFAYHEAVTLARRGLNLLKSLPETSESAPHQLTLRMITDSYTGFAEGVNAADLKEAQRLPDESA